MQKAPIAALALVLAAGAVYAASSHAAAAPNPPQVRSSTNAAPALHARAAAPLAAHEDRDASDGDGETNDDGK
ncbi:MAG TPA: hypothetical protein VGD01_04060 [Candidatus Elarobacter sp.]|jgi:hypothetical protein